MIWMSRKGHVVEDKLSCMGEMKQKKATGEAHRVVNVFLRALLPPPNLSMTVGSIKGFFSKPPLNYNDELLTERPLQKQMVNVGF